MPVIKRYPNRKLYDTAAKQYVSLENVAEMIRRGDPVQVLDHASGDDHTTQVLTQIIAEQEKRGSGFLPLDILTSLVQAGGNTLVSLRQRLAAPLDLLHQVDEEIQARIDKLIGLGELAEDEGRRLAQRLVALGAAVRAERESQEDALQRALEARGIPTRERVAQLSEMIDRLSAEVDSLKQ